jgi:TolB-like protein
MNRSIIIGAIIISAAILVNGFLERRAHIESTVSAVATPAVALPDQPIAVLPFENLSEEKANADFAEGIRREIVARLTTRHVKAASVQQAPHTGELLVGSVERAGNRVRVTVHLVDATTRIPHWSETYDRELSDIFALQSEIAENIAKAVATKQKT